MPLPVPTRPWDFVLIDFVTNLPNVDGYDAILTILCTLSKMAHLSLVIQRLIQDKLLNYFLITYAGYMDYPGF